MAVSLVRWMWLRRPNGDQAMPNWVMPLLVLIVLVGFVGFAFRQGMKQCHALRPPTKAALLRLVGLHGSLNFFGEQSEVLV
jgi:hypothetical protein